MLIQYCESCGSRVSESDFHNGAVQLQDKAYCPKCAVAVPKQKKPPTGGPHPPTRVSEKGTSNGPLTPINKPATGKAPAVPSHKPHAHSHHNTHAPKQSGSAGVMAIVGIGALLLIGGVVFMQKSKNETEVSAPKPEEKKSASPTKPNPPAPNTNATASTPPVTATQPPPPQVDPKEEYAAKRWAELKDLEKKLQPWAARKELEQFVSIYGNTPAGKEAAAYIQKLPPVPPPSQQPGDHSVLWSSDFETDGSGVSVGTRTLDNAFGGKGYSLKSVSQDGGYFTSKMTLDFRRNGTEMIAIGENSWLRLACYVDGTDTICLHTSIGNSVYEKYVKNLPKGKWNWITFKISEYASLKDKTQPKPGTTFNSSTIFGAMWNAKTTVYVDNIMLGDGPIPPEPK